MDLHQLEVFCAACEEGSFSRAASRLGLTQPTVSAHVRSLEEELGGRLFDRLGRTVQPTRAGRLLHQRAREILVHQRGLREEMHRLLHGFAGPLELGASAVPGEVLLPALIGRFHDRHPKAEVRLAIATGDTVLERVRQGEVEAGFVGMRPSGEGLKCRPFARDRLVLAAPATAWEGRDRITLAELRRERLVLPGSSSGTRRIFEERLGELGESPGAFRVVAELGSPAAAREAVRAGLGVALVSLLAIRAEVAAGLLRSVEIAEMEGLDRAFYAVTDRRRESSPLCRSFLELVEEAALAAP